MYPMTKYGNSGIKVVCIHKNDDFIIRSGHPDFDLKSILCIKVGFFNLL